MLQPRKAMLVLLVSIYTLLPGVFGQRCPQGWPGYKDKCYFISTTTADWVTAKSICETRGGNLASVSSMDEAAFLRNQTRLLKPELFYVGANDRQKEGTWTNLDNSPFPKDKSVWGKGQPDDHGAGEDCGSFLSFNDYRLNDAPCDSSYQYICERPITYKDPCDSENGWHLVDGKCYRFFQEGLNWLEARQSCQDQDADLITINSTSELALVTESVSCSNRQSMWLGYSDVNDLKLLQWVDGSTPGKNLYKWDKKNKDASKAKYAKGHNCAAVITLNKNQWEVTNCIGNDMAYICEKEQGQCPSGWRLQDGMCYKNVYNLKTWPQAKKECEKYGAELPTVKLASKVSVLSMFFGFWVGLSDRATDGQFADLAGNPVPATTLAAQKPNQIFECGVYVRGQLQVKDCYSSNYFTCYGALAAVQAKPATEKPDGLACHNNWIKNKDTCYRRFSKQISYKDAQAACKAQSTTQTVSLLKIDNVEEMDFLVGDSLLLNTQSYIGLDDLKTTKTFLWNDGTTPNFVNWAPGEPNSVKNNEHCVEVRSRSMKYPGSWNDIPCDTGRSYICEMKAVSGDTVTTAKPTRPWTPECGAGWVANKLSNKCYYFSLDVKTWKDARNVCKKMNSDLMSIESKYEQSFVQGILGTDTVGALAYWIGGNDLDFEQGWRWTDRTPFKYFNWNTDAGEPNSNGDEDCIEVVQLTGKWNDNNCASLRNFICEKKNKNAAVIPGAFTTTPIPSITDKCKKVELISGDHWVPDSALTASSVRDKDSGPENSRIDWTATDAKIKISTSNKYFYKPVANMNLKGVTMVTFTVTACSDAHISLQPSMDNITRDTYEVVIGGWSDTKSAIRKEHQGALTVQKKTPNILNCKTARPFWISWATGNIQVGNGNKVTTQSMIMELKVTESLTISGMAVTTGFGVDGEWVITNPHGTRKGAWSPKYKVPKVPIGTEQFVHDQWIQVDFDKPTLIRSVTTKGSASANEYVTEYFLKYSYDKPWNYQPYFKPGSKEIRLFPGNKNRQDPRTNNVEMPFEAQYVRLYPKKFINYPSVRWALNGCPPPKYCNPEKLVTGESMVEDKYILTSSVQGSTSYDARLSKVGNRSAPLGWIAAAPDTTLNSLSEEWLQIFLKRDMLIHGIITKGHAKQKYWVTSYQIQTRSSADKKIFVNYQEPYGTIKTFSANKDQNSAVRNMLANPVIASYVRIIPKEFNGMIAMRVDVLGCLEGCSLSPMINGPNPISYERLSASSSLSGAMGPNRALLDTTGFGSAWQPKSRKGDFFWQVDFGVSERIRAISTQGRGDKDQWVRQYALSYSSDAKTFYKYQGKYRFPGNSDRNTKVKNFFYKEIFARAVRVHPKAWTGAPAMRIELYGCSGSTAKYVGCFVEGLNSNSFAGPTAYMAYNGPAKCAATCFKSGYMYAGLRRETCKCGNRLPYGGQSSRCDYKCKGNKNYECGGYDTGLVSLYETGIGPDDERCAVGYETYNSRCYKLNKDKLSWQDARKVCQADGGDLATINSYSDQSFIRTKLSKLTSGAWIGLNDLRDQMSFEWADGSPVKVTFWQHSEPNNWAGKKEDCVEAISWAEMGKGYIGANLKSANGWWNDRQCEESRYSICQKKKERIPGPTATPAPAVGCKPNWKAYQTSCYQLIETSTTWDKANSICTSEGGSLVRIDDALEQSFVTNELYRRAGYVNDDGVTTYWTDLRQNPLTKSFRWSNRWDVIPYTNWGKGEPKTTTYGLPLITGWWRIIYSNCVAMNGKNEEGTGLWITMNCNNGSFPLCEKPRDGYTQPPLPTLSMEDIQCPDGWESIGPNCYQVNAPADDVDKKNWEDAERHCARQGAHLAFINNGTENEDLWRRHLLQPNSFNNRYWIGLNDRAIDKGYEWVSGEGFTFENWKQGEPNDWDGLEPCVMIDGADGLWNDEKCHLLMNWICSIEKGSVKKIRRIYTTPEPTPGPSSGCAQDGADWKFFHKHCYYVNKNLLSFREANAFCRTKGGSLVSLQSSRENSFVRAISKDLITNFADRDGFRANIGSVRTPVWTGLNELDRSKGHRWVDNSWYSWSNWALNEPNDFNGGEYCVEMSIVSGEWNDVHCSIKIPSVCEKDPNQSGPITTILPPRIDGYCPDGYMGFENFCYKMVVDQRMNWTSAEFTCETEGGHLASIMNSREQTFLTSQLNVAKRAGVALWIGLQHGSVKQTSFFSHDTSYLWADNQDVAFTEWNHGEPNGLDQEACVEMLFNPAGRWNDVSCASERGYVCKKKKDGTIKTPPTVKPSSCPSGYVYWENACYKFVSGKKTWDYFDSTVCHADQATLLSIQDPYEYAFIRTMLWKQSVTDDVWIGLKSVANTNSFSWSNNWPVVVTYWGANEPKTFPTKPGCVFMNSGMGEDDGKWTHADCSISKSGICKKSFGQPQFTTNSSGICRSAAGEQWLPGPKNSCYFFNVDPRFTFAEAESVCRSAGANLASLHSDQDTQFVKTQMEHMDVKGGNGGTKNVWIGLRKKSSGAFWWTDNSAVYYTNWADKEPNAVEDNEKCTEVWSPNADWNDVDCQSKRGFICKIAQGTSPMTFPPEINNPPTTTPPTTPRTDPCPLDGWSFYKGNCYLLVSQKNELRRWNEASDYCSRAGMEAQLASIHSEAENQWIVNNLLPTNLVGEAWLGLAELSRDNHFRWIDQSTIPYVNWDTDQPDTNIGSQECVTMRTDGDPGVSGRWSTRYCFDKKAFICKMDSKTQVTKTIGVPVTDGSLCHFPFSYKGQKFTTCTTAGSSFLWCATTDHYERDRQFAICDPFRCPDGWKRHERLCYYFSPAVDTKTWLHADQECERRSSNLAYIGSSAVESFISDNINEFFWIGLNDRQIEGAYIWDHRPNMVMTRGFTNWGIGEPRTVFGTEDCTEIVNGPYADERPGEWVMENCDQPRRYICMKDAQYTLGTTSTPAPPQASSTPKVIILPGGSTASAIPPTGKPGVVGVTEGYNSNLNPTSANTSLTTGGIVAIVIATLATVLAAVFIFLYARRTQTGEMSAKPLAFENASYSRSKDTVQVGLENPGASY